LLFAALGTEAFTTVLLRISKSISQVRLAVKIGRFVPTVFGLAGALILVSGSYLAYLDWHYGEEIGWIIVAASAFVAISVFNAITGRKFDKKLARELALNREMTSSLTKLTRSRSRIIQLGASTALTLGILVVMVFQPSVAASILILINALIYGVIFTAIPGASASGKPAENDHSN
jgi:hypothetical protein